MKVIIKDIIGHILWKSGFTKPSSYARDKLVVLTFHRVLTEAQRKQYPLPALAVTPEELDWYCSEFTNHFNCGPLTPTYDSWLNNKKSEKPYLAITFDDGQLDNFLNAKPVLDKHNLKATFYVPVQNINTQDSIWHDRLGFAAQACEASGSKQVELTDLTKNYFSTITEADMLGANIIAKAKLITPDKREQLVLEVEDLAGTDIPDWAGMMSWKHLKELLDDGHEIGSHTMSHALLPQLDNDELYFELTESRKILQQKLGIEIESFCYPNGDEDSRIQKAVEKAGYKNAVSTQHGRNDRTVNKYTIKRLCMNPFQLLYNNNKLSNTRLHFRLSGLHPGLK